MEEDPQNKENKVKKKGTGSDSLIPKTANYPLTGTVLFIESQHPQCMVHLLPKLYCGMEMSEACDREGVVFITC